MKISLAIITFQKIIRCAARRMHKKALHQLRRTRTWVVVAQAIELCQDDQVNVKALLRALYFMLEVGPCLNALQTDQDSLFFA